jgi:Mg2+ and Co2+ transporter CorA
MNVEIPGQHEEDWWPFLGIVGFIEIAILFAIFKKKKLF